MQRRSPEYRGELVHQRPLRRDIGLAIDAQAAILDRAFAYFELLRDLARALPHHDERQYFTLSPREVAERCGNLIDMLVLGFRRAVRLQRVDASARRERKVAIERLGSQNEIPQFELLCRLACSCVHDLVDRRVLRCGLNQELLA